MERTTTGKELAEDGMERAAKSADKKHPEWSEKAYGFLINYIATHAKFMTEDVRRAAEGKIADPPSQRAWGSVITRASRLGLIQRLGYRSVTNKKAHGTPATVWGVKFD